VKLSDGQDFSVRGQATLTIAQANEDDTMTGTLIYILPDDLRQKIAQSSGRKLADIPANVIQKELKASFRRGTACPLIKLQVATREADISGAKLYFDRVILDIYETPDQLNQLFCSWARQVNVNRQRRGIIAAINRLIQAEATDKVENNTANP
jgi:hypothetical protein